MQLIAFSIREKRYCAEDPSVMLIHTTMSTFDMLDQEITHKLNGIYCKLCTISMDCQLPSTKL
jgi:hypothetical protein